MSVQGKQGTHANGRSGQVRWAQHEVALVWVSNVMLPWVCLIITIVCLL